MSAVASSPPSGWKVFTPEDAKTTMMLMARKVRASLKDPYVVRAAHEVIAAVRPRDFAAQIGAIRLYMETYFYFVDNPIGLQLIQPPAEMLHDIAARGMAQGACDDAAVLVAALAMADGLPARFVAYAFGHRTGNAAADNSVPFTHVIADVFDGVAWITLDVTRPEELTRLPDVLRTLTVDV